jgi:DNA mismatch repair protein PMS2
MRGIQNIDEESIHRLCSSQVVTDLGTAIKELVENALDAEASIVEIKLRNFGSESIEVCDNGKGISPVDFKNIAEKHATSKLQVFEQINNVKSFGFRGEALNALCELSGRLSVITKRDCDNMGTILEFNRLGR